MSKKESYSIGEFSKRTGTSIWTLQYYDGILYDSKWFIQSKRKR